MNRYTSRSEAKLNSKMQLALEEKLPFLSTPAIPPKKGNPLTDRDPPLFLSSPMIEKSAKNLLLMRKINVVKSRGDEDSSEDSIEILRRLESGKKQKMEAGLTVLRRNEDRKSYLKHPLISESLVGKEAIQKFYQRYKHLDKRKEQEEFLNEKHSLTSIVTLLQMHNFTPRKLNLVKMKGEEAILDLKKLGIGQGSMGPVVSDILDCLQQFQEIDLSFNRIDPQLCEDIIRKVSKTRVVNLSHNRIGKVGCQQFSQLFLTDSTRIQELYLDENSLLDSAGVLLLEHLHTYNTLRVLSLNKNYLGLKFAQKMKKFLRSGDAQMRELYLSWNEFSSKAARFILEGVAEHTYLKVIDFSWNRIDHDNAYFLAKVFEEAVNLVHADFSFCELSLKSMGMLGEALKNNNTLYGLHLEGNSGFIDHRGFLVPTEKEFSQYPLPIIKGVIRSIRGVLPNPSNEYKESTSRDVCWICHSWQQKTFVLPFTHQMQQEASNFSSLQVDCYIHFKHEQYKAVKMFLNEDKTQFSIERMCPLGWDQFFFTFSPAPGHRNILTSPHYPVIDSPLTLNYSIGRIQVSGVVQQRNNLNLGYDMDPVDEGYEPNIELLPRGSEAEIDAKQRLKLQKKRKVLKQQKMEVELKDLGAEEDDDFLKDKANRQDDQVIVRRGTAKMTQEYLLKCIDFDLKNSKIQKLIKQQSLLSQFKYMMLRYYSNFKDIFYYLSRFNPSTSGIFSVSQLDFQGFIEEQKYTTKRVNQAKIMLKLYATLSAGDEESPKKAQGIGKKVEEKMPNKLISRPQFLQFLVRLAIEKWCSFNPKKNRKALVDKFKLFEMEQSKMLSLRRGLSKNVKTVKLQKLDKQESKTKNMVSKPSELVSKEPKQPVLGDIASPLSVNQSQTANFPEDQLSEEEQEMKKSKLELPLPLIDGIERTMKTLGKYAENYRTSSWRKRKYLKIDILIVLKAYDQFLNALYQKYTNSKFFKTGKPKKLANLMTLEEIKTMFLDTDIRQTKEAMRQMQQAFLDAKRLSIEDGTMQFGLNYAEFQECIARVAESVWFNPPAAPHAIVWDNEINRKNTPLFLRFEALIIALYWRTPDLHNRRLTRLADKGIFELEIDLILEKVNALGKQSGSLYINRMNSMKGQEESITLKEIVEELREMYDNMVVHREVQEDYEEEVVQ